MAIQQAQFAITSDVDWASEDCVADFLDLVTSYGVKPTMFATHKSCVLDRYAKRGLIEIGLHPNFLPGSTHGATIPQVVDHVRGLYPKSQCFRSHSFMDGTPITAAMKAAGMLYDSNLCLYMQAGLAPLQHWSGILRFPVFWEDDCHWERSPGRYDFFEFAAAFESPGLKVLNIHPVHGVLNSPSSAYYRSLGVPSSKLTRDSIKSLRYQGAGTRTFLTSMVESTLRSGSRFYTLSELYNHHCGNNEDVLWPMNATSIGKATMTSAKSS